jgi:hypothetical protein
MDLRPQAQETNDVSQQSAEITQASFSNLETSGMSEITPVSLAMTNAGVETVNFEPSKLELTTADLTPAPSYRTASLSGTNTSRPVVTPAASYVAPKESSVVSTGLPNKKTSKPLDSDLYFPRGWIEEANGTKRETNKTWMA